VITGKMPVPLFGKTAVALVKSFAETALRRESSLLRLWPLCANFRKNHL